MLLRSFICSASLLPPPLPTAECCVPNFGLLSQTALQPLPAVPLSVCLGLQAQQSYRRVWRGTGEWDPGLPAGRRAGEHHVYPRERLLEIVGTPVPASFFYTGGCSRPQSCFPEPCRSLHPGLAQIHPWPGLSLGASSSRPSRSSLLVT